MRLTVLNIKDVAEGHLCCGCGACAYLDPDQVTMVDDIERGRRPLIEGQPALSPAHQEAFAACPGRHLEHDYDRTQPGLVRELEAAWGPVLAMWEGHATDEKIRFAGSSGGAATALAAFAVEQQGLAGVLHIAARQDAPYLNETVFSTTRDELLARTGSRYAPASPCDSLYLIEEAGAPCVFIGKPCDVAAVSKARKLRPALDAKVGITIAIFCAGTPSTRGTFEVLKAMGIDNLSEIESIRYRGNGWPGMFAVDRETPSGRMQDEVTYAKSWDEILQKHRQWRCYICPDHTGEFADISVGDPWHVPPDGNDPGRSLVMARTARGLAIIEAAIRGGALSLKPVDPEVLPNSQPHVLRVRAAVWPRNFVLHLMGAATPNYYGFRLFTLWWRQTSVLGKVRSLISTARRVWRKKLNRRCPVQAVSITALAGPAPSAICKIDSK